MARELLKTITDRRKNYFINGDMSVAQRGTSFAAAAGSTYSLDRMFYQKNGSMIHTISQDSDVPTVDQAGYAFKYSMRFNLTTPDTSLAAGEFVAFGQKIEGYNFADISGRAFTVSFWVKATLPGVYCISATNSGADRTYVAEYTINTANTWEKKTISILASPSSGTWNYTNGTGLWLRWCLGTGTNGQTGTVNSWISGGGMVGSTNQVNGVNTGATDFRITGVMVNEGVTAAPFSLFGLNISEEIDTCKRYYQKTYALNTAPGTVTGEGVLAYFADNVSMTHDSNYYYSPEMRSTPSVTVYNPVTGVAGSGRQSTGTDRNFSGMGAHSSRMGRFVFAAGATPTTQYITWHAVMDAEL